MLCKIICQLLNYFTYDYNIVACNTGKNDRFPILDILGYLKNTHRNPKFGKVR